MPPIPKIKLPDSLKKLTGFSLPAAKKQVLSLEIGDSWIKMAAVREGQVAALEASLIEGESDLDISQKITAFLKKESLKPTDVILSHPSHNLTTRILSLPSVDPKEIKDIVDLQAVKQTPYSREEITAGFQILDSDASGYSRVLVTISHREVAARYFKIVELAGLYQARMTASLEGARGWFKTLISKGKIQKEEPFLFLDVDWTTTDLHLFSGDKIIYSRSIGLGAKNLMGQGAAVENEFVREIQRSMESGASELKGGVIGSIVVSGVQKPLKDFSAALVRELNLPCEVMGGLDGVPALLAPSAADDYSVSFITVMGIALNPSAIAIDLTPAEIQVRKSIEQRAKDLAFSGTLLLALISLVSLISVEKIYKRSGYLSQLKKQYQSISSEAESVERLVAKMKLAQDQAGGQNGVLDVLKDITEVIPPNIILSAMNYNSQDRSIVIRGVSSEMSGVFQFLTTLEGTPVLEQVKTRNVSKRKTADKELAEFEISANIRSGPPVMSSPDSNVIVLPAVSGGPEIQGAK